MVDELVFLLYSECGRLDAHAGCFWNNKELKQVRLKLAEVQYLLQDGGRYRSDQNSSLRSWFTDLTKIVFDIDQLMDDWEQSQISKHKIHQEVRRINGLLVPLLNSFQQLVADPSEEKSSFPKVIYGQYDEYGVFEEHGDALKNIIYSLSLPDDKAAHIIPIVGMRGTGRTVLAHKIYNDEKVKSHFPFRAWVSVGENLDLTTIAKELHRLSLTLRGAEKKVDRGGVFYKRTLVVLDDVRDENCEKLKQLRSLVSACRPGSSVLVTTPFNRVAELLGTVPAHYLTFSQFKPELTASYVVTAKVERHSTSKRQDGMTCHLSPQFGGLIDTALAPYTTSEIVSDQDPVSSRENLIEDVLISPPQIGTFYAESMSSVDDYPAPSPENLSEDEMTCIQSMEMLTVHESEIKLASLKAEELAVHVPRTIATTSDGKERMLPAHEVKFEATPFQKGEGRDLLVSNASVQQSVDPVVPIVAIKLPTINVTTEKSVQRNVQKILKYVNDAKVSIIGVHGVGGIGKTTVLKALINYLEKKNVFHVIILVTVSRCWNTRKVQNKLLRKLSLSREDNETDLDVAGKLSRVLIDKKFLLLLDDVWEQIDLGEVGIPVPSLENECKIIVASREPDVCQNLKGSVVVELETLSWKEAWKLFYKESGGIIHSPDIQPFARGIVKGCCGLPLLIIVTGRALMEENNICVWEHASKKFSVPGTARICHAKDMIRLLKFSFDQLKDHDTKSCFLYCGLFPEDHDVNIFRFIDYCIQEDIVSGTGLDALKRGRDIVNVLVHSSLVHVTECGNSIRMHGSIRDLALGILSSAAKNSPCLMRVEGGQFLLRAYSRLTESSNTGSSSSSSSLKSPESSQLFIPETHQFLLGAGADLSEPPPKEEWTPAKIIFLMDNNLCTLPDRPSCPSLLTLFLQRNLRLRVIPPSFFESMTSLKVLNLSKTRIDSLPKMIVRLQNLQILILRDCERLLMLPSEVGSLECLEVLDVRGTEINELPNEIGKLASLRYLEVCFYGSTDESEYVKLPRNLISSDTISGLQVLETLSIVVYPEDERWYKDVKSVITEVNKLTKLSSLCFYFPEVEHVKEFVKESVAWKDQSLTKFKFVVGHEVKSIISRVPDHVEFDYNRQGKCLRFVNGEKTSPEVLQILARSTAFYLDHHLDIDSLSDFEVSNFNGLKFCIISECLGVKTVVNIKEHTTAVFPILENLSIHHLWNLTCICKGIIPDGSFAELRILSMRTCPKLEYVFTSSMIRFLTNLEELTVEDCPAINSIILEGEIIDSSSIALPSLKKLRSHYLPGLVNIWENAWPSLEYISFFDCPQLKKIGIDSNLKNTLIEIKAEKNWWDELQWEDTDLRSHFEDRLTLICEDDV